MLSTLASTISAVVFGLWGTVTLVFGLLAVKARLDLIAAANRVALAEHYKTLADQKHNQLEIVLKQILDRPAEAFLKDEQVRQLSQDIYRNVMDIRDRKLGIN